MFSCFPRCAGGRDINTKLEILHEPGKNESYLPGSKITGVVVLSNKFPNELKSIKIRFSGKSKVSWSAGKSQYSDEERYFNQEITLVENGCGTIVLEAGSWKYPFEYHLPMGLPSSSIHSFGRVWYYMKAFVKWPSLVTSSLQIKVPFIVSNIANLTSKHLRRIALQETASDVCPIFCFCCTGDVCFEIKLCRGGYLLGEVINFEICIKNRSMWELIRTSVVLVKITDFKAKGFGKREKAVIEILDGPKVLPGGRMVGAGNLKIPRNTFPTGGCRLIDVNYALRVEVKPGHLCGEVVSQYIPVTVGTRWSASSGYKQLRGNRDGD